jgi:hypothetical protein
MLGQSALSCAETTRAPAIGPLHIHPANPRYFADGSGKAVYLTGSHHWDNFQRWFEGIEQSGLTAGRLGEFPDYLDVLTSHGHNFVRLWVADTAWSPITKEAIEPQPYLRTGPGEAAGGGLKFDLNQLNQAYFDKLRSCVIAAGDRGMYVSVMLFNSWGISRYGSPLSKTWPYHPFHAANNVNHIDGDPNGDQRGLEYHTLDVPAITRLQEAYVRKVVDSVGDLDNVLFEISNESHETSKDWQFYFTRFLHEYQAIKPKRHLVIMTGYTISNDDLFAGPAEVIAPTSYGNDPPEASGAKIVIVDSDHNGPHRRDPGFAWRALLRGHHPIVMDWWSGPAWHPLRNAMGQTRRYAERIGLAAMTPQKPLSSTGYCLAKRGFEYLVYQPASQTTFTVSLAAGSYDFEWFDPAAGTVAATGAFSAPRGDRAFAAPFDGEAVLYIKGRKSP